MKKIMTIILSSILIGSVVTAYIIDKCVWKKYFDLSKDFEFYKKISRLAIYMVIQKQRGNKCCEYIKNTGIDSVAIYQNGELAEVIVNELAEVGIQIECFISEDVDINSHGIRVVNLKEQLCNVDAIIVCDIRNFKEKKELLCKYYNLPILSLEEVIFSYTI